MTPTLQQRWGLIAGAAVLAVGQAAISAPRNEFGPLLLKLLMGGTAVGLVNYAGRGLAEEIQELRFDAQKRVIHRRRQLASEALAARHALAGEDAAYGRLQGLHEAQAWQAATGLGAEQYAAMREGELSAEQQYRAELLRVEQEAQERLHEQQLAMTKLQAELVAKHQPAKPPQTQPGAAASAGQSGPQFYNWDSLYDDATGIMLIGNPGSAKSTAAVWLVGKLTQTRPAQVLALDIHGNTNPNWARFGIPVINRPEAIEQQLELLDQLLLARREMSPAELARQDDVIVINDELGGCLTEFKKPEIVKRTIDRLGAQGRKYRITLVTISHSKNSEDMGGSSAAMLRNYTQILFCAQAVNFAESTWKQDDPRSAYVRSVAYPVVINGAIQAQLAVHPTHGHHAVFRKTGNEPKWEAFLPIQKRPLTIALAEEYEHLGGSQADQLNRLFYRQAEFDVQLQAEQPESGPEDTSPSSGLDNEVDKEIVEWLAKRNDGAKARDLKRLGPALCRSLSTAKLKEHLTGLKSLGYVTCRSVAGDEETWFYVP